MNSQLQAWSLLYNSQKCFKVPIKSSDSIYHPMNFSEKNFNWINWPPFWSTIRTNLPWFGMSCDIHSVTPDFRLDKSCFTSVNLTHNHTKYWKGAFCIDYKAKFTEIKQAGWVKPEVTHSLIYVTTLNMSILWSAAWINRKKIGYSGFKIFIKKSLFI